MIDNQNLITHTDLMHINATVLAEQEKRFGQPNSLSMTQEIDLDELELVRHSIRKQRTHDITFFILDGNRVVVIKKPFFPDGAYRAPSGGINPGEPFLSGVRREAFEETGLDIELDRYLLRIQATLTCADETEIWWTHVFSAHANGVELDPQDTVEIAEARWVSLEELQGPIRQTLLDTGRGLFNYRVWLTDETIKVLNHSS
jgi:8-oxo-dGTP pyrophosphatase MutT (NUDIX family)